MGTDRQVEVDGRELKLTNLDKVLYPEAGFTKGEVVDYYAKVGGDDGPPPERPRGDPAPLPRRRRRPRLRLLREALPQAPAEMGEDDATVRAGPERRQHRLLRLRRPADPDLDGAAGGDRAAPLALAGAGADAADRARLRPRPRRGPDVVDCCRVAMRLRDLFGHFGVESFPKTSGSKGMQVYVPLNTPKTSYDETKPFAKAIAQLLEKQTPDKVVSKMKKVERKGKVMVDWSQNHRSKTTIAVYSLRARERPDRLDPDHLGRGRARRRERGRRLTRLRGRRRARADRGARRPLRPGARAQAGAARALALSAARATSG